MPKKSTKHKIVIKTERVIQTRNEILITDEELAVLRACGGGLNEGVIALVEKHGKGKAKHVSTKSIWRCEIEEGDDCLAKWSTDTLAED